MSRWGEVMFRIQMLACLFVVLLAGPCAAQVGGSPWVWGPHLGAVSEESIAISWMTARSVAIDLHYGLARVYDATGTWDETLTLDRHDGAAEIWLRDLLAGEVYRYQVVIYEGDAVFPSEAGTFRTPSESLRTFSFAAYGGTSSLPDRHKLVSQTIAETHPGAPVFHMGDLMDVGQAEPLATTFWAIADLARSRPFFPIVGDSDVRGSEYFDAFALPLGGGIAQEQWWSFDYGNIHFVGLDSTLTHPNDAATMREQVNWLAQDLATAAGKFVVVFAHHPLYSSAYPNGVSTVLRDALEPLFRAHNVRLILSGGTNWYEHIYIDGIHHVTTGGGGGPLTGAPETSVPGTVFRRVGLLHYVRVTVADDALRVEAIPVASVSGESILLVPSGRSIDSFVLRRPSL